MCLVVLLLNSRSTHAKGEDLNIEITDEMKAKIAQAAYRPHPLTNLPADAPGIEAAYVFPKNPGKTPQFPAGKMAKLAPSMLHYHRGLYPMP